MARSERHRGGFDWFFRPHGPAEDAPLSAEARFAELLAELPAVERSALALSEIGGLGTEEIAERLGTNEDVVETVLTRARSTMRARLDSRRGLTALLPLQSWFSGGTASPALRAAGAVAATVAIGAGVPSASADRPTARIRPAERPVAHALARPAVAPAPRLASATPAEPPGSAPAARPRPAAHVRLTGAGGHHVDDSESWNRPTGPEPVHEPRLAAEPAPRVTEPGPPPGATTTETVVETIPAPIPVPLPAEPVPPPPAVLPPVEVPQLPVPAVPLP